MHSSRVWLAVLYALTRTKKPMYDARSWFNCALRSAFRVNRPSLQPSSGVPPNWKHLTCLSSILKAHAVMIKENTLLHISISMTPCHLFKSLRLPSLGTGTR